MPYRIDKNNNIINKKTGKRVAHSDTRAKAEASVRARLAGEHGWKPTKRK